jgi:hypothetical protein
MYMNHIIKQAIVWLSVVTCGVCMLEFHSRTQSKTYQTAYADAVNCFRQWLLDVEYAEYDRKTGEWKLSDADTIQGSMIKPWDRKSYVNIHDHIDALEHELRVLKLQQETINKRKPTASSSKPDLAKAPL